MHICFICNEYPPGGHGGVGIFTQTLARALVRCGHRATVVGKHVLPQSPAEEDSGVRIIRIAPASMPGTRFILNSAAIRSRVTTLNASDPVDVIEGPENTFCLLARGDGFPKLIRMHGGHHFFAATLGKKPALWRGWQERRSFHGADHLCAVSRYVAEMTRKLVDLGDVPIEILPNPVDTDAFRPRPEIPEESGLIVFAGTVCEKKGIRQLIQAMPAILAAVPNARLYVLGRDSIDPATGRSFTEGLRQNLPDATRMKIHFEGAVAHDTIWRFLARAEVCVYPSHMEALPLSWLEGLACGKAVVASKTGPGPEVIDHGVAGLLANPHNPASIAEQVVHALKSPDLRRSLGDAARKRALDHFSISALVNRNIDFYERCVHAPSRSSAVH